MAPKRRIRSGAHEDTHEDTVAVSRGLGADEVAQPIEADAAAPRTCLGHPIADRKFAAR
jgi:hypothetical protein